MKPMAFCGEKTEITKCLKNVVQYLVEQNI